jgi:hypothetical protein
MVIFGFCAHSSGLGAALTHQGVEGGASSRQACHGRSSPKRHSMYQCPHCVGCQGQCPPQPCAARSGGGEGSVLMRSGPQVVPDLLICLNSAIINTLRAAGGQSSSPQHAGTPVLTRADSPRPFGLPRTPLLAPMHRVF